MEFLQRLVLIWRKVGLIQRALLVAVVLASALIGSLLIHWARSPDMRMLYQDLEPAEATEKISEKAIPYELRDGGTTIYAPRQHIYQLRLDLAKEGLPVGGQSGYKLFDDEKIGVSPFVQNVNLKRALQDELAKSIQMIDGVEHARVHIVNPEQKLLASEEEQTTASVILRLRPGYRLSATNIAAITHLVSGSIKGLRAETVSIIDSEGRLLSGEADSTLATGAGTVHDYKQRVEQGLARKAEEMLTTVLGPGRATVRVSAVIDMNSISTITETYDPTAKVSTKEEVTNNSETGAGGSGQQTAAGTTKKDETVITEYQVGKTVTQEVVLPGEIKTLSVAAFVDLYADANEPASGEQAPMIMDVLEEGDGLSQSRQCQIPPVPRASHRGRTGQLAPLLRSGPPSLFGHHGALCGGRPADLQSGEEQGHGRSARAVTRGYESGRPAALRRAFGRTAVLAPPDYSRPEEQPGTGKRDVPQLDSREGVDHSCR